LTQFSVRWATLGATLYFSADDGIHGQELWCSDGTAAGSWMVKDLCPGSCSGFRQFDEIVALGSALLLVANDGAHGRELWRSDGTAAGTALVRDIVAGLPPSGPQWLTVANGLVFFVLPSAAASGGTLWRSDGTEAGTTQIADFSGPGQSAPERLTALGSLLLFFADDGASGGEPWKSDGTAAGTVLLADIAPGSASGVALGSQSFPVDRELAIAGAKFFFSADDGTHGNELWISDGTSAGTQLVKDVHAGNEDGQPFHLCAANGIVFFRAVVPGLALELWKSDGTEAGTQRVAGTAPRSFTHCLGNQVFFDGESPAVTFEATGIELMTSDGTEAGTVQVKDIRPGAGSSLNLTFGLGVGAVGSRLLFWADDGTHGLEPWVSDGTLDGTLLLGDLELGAFPSAAPGVMHTLPASLGGEAFFFALATGHGWEPWRTDGTPGGTQLLAETNSQLSSRRRSIQSWFPVGLLDHQGTLAFLPDDGAHGFELWRSQGTAETTSLVRDIQLDEGDGAFLGFTFPSSLIGKVFFGGADAPENLEPWVSDLTCDGTELLADTEPGPAGGDPFGFAEAGGLVFFASAGKEWETDGTPEGTQLATQPRPPAPPSPLACQLFEVTAAALGKTFFVGDDPDHGQEPWARSAPGDPGALVLDIRTGKVGSHPTCLTATSGRVYFVADDGVHGREPWVTDGTPAGTHLLVDVRPGPQSSTPRELVDWMGRLVFAADDDERVGEAGIERVCAGDGHRFDAGEAGDALDERPVERVHFLEVRKVREARGIPVARQLILH
ncbi:MAG: ELWxxDGT repeat protein, partial [Thermoanaerobaculia bacterium]